MFINQGSLTEMRRLVYSGDPLLKDHLSVMTSLMNPHVSYICQANLPVLYIKLTSFKWSP